MKDTYKVRDVKALDSYECRNLCICIGILQELLSLPIRVLLFNLTMNVPIAYSWPHSCAITLSRLTKVLGDRGLFSDLSHKTSSCLGKGKTGFFGTPQSPIKCNLLEKKQDTIQKENWMLDSQKQYFLFNITLKEISKGIPFSFLT